MRWTSAASKSWRSRPCRAPRSSPGCLTLPASRTRWVSMRRRLPI
nr:MAG TPA: Rpp20 subunit of nuclear RNase MRP and P [Caudoviricetes sp.]DAL48694.1 MAG TPA_asm: Rpp20 subunit of nuclear RNase MRP and P [Caudoviricetes sp.]